MASKTLKRSVSRETTAEPFSIEHFQFWAQTLKLDNGKPWLLEDFQLAFIEDIFAGFKESWLVVPEGNGKTTLVAGLALYHLRFREEAMVPIAASSRDQARIMYRQAKGFIQRSGLQSEDKDGLWLEAFDGYRRIDLRQPSSRTKRGTAIGTMEVHAADERTGDGIIPTLCILDELHRHPNLDLYEVWRGKLDKRPGQLVAISTAGEPGGDFEETRARIRAMGAGEQQGTFLRAEHPELVLHEWALPESGDVENFAMVAEANPFSGITEPKLRTKFSTPSMTMAHWRRFTCNIPTLGDDVEPFIASQDWDSLGDGIEIPANARVCLGADGSRTWDTTVVAWASVDGERIDVDARVFSVRPDQPRHVLHSGGKIDFDDVESFIIDRFDLYNVLDAAYDPRYLERSMEIVDQRLGAEATFPVEPQSKVMRGALQVFYRLVAEGKLRHCGDPVLRAHIENSKVERDERTQEIRRIGKIDRRKAIDAVPAMALAVWRAERAEGSVYDERELVMA